jgi:hypothetical protein
LGKESIKRFIGFQKNPKRLEDNKELRWALLDFIADTASWENCNKKEYLETSRAITQAAHEALGGTSGMRPLVVDPFAGGGAIPLEAIRIGADAFSSDLNPVAVWNTCQNMGNNSWMRSENGETGSRKKPKKK